jgi:hypothetical protein
MKAICWRMLEFTLCNSPRMRVGALTAMQIVKHIWGRLSIASIRERSRSYEDTFLPRDPTAAVWEDETQTQSEAFRENHVDMDDGFPGVEVC